VTSQLWAPGTLAAAAFTPVLVAVLKEALAKPAEVVTRAVPVRGVVRSTSSAGEPVETAYDTPEAIEERISQLGEARGASRPGHLRRNWQIAVVTGLLGFIIAAVIITVPEIVAGNSVAGGGRDTTLFSTKKSSSSAPTDTTTTTTPSEDGTETVPPASTVTVAPPETITVPPPAPVPIPEEGEPAPVPEEETPEVPATPPPPPAPPG